MKKIVTIFLLISALAVPVFAQEPKLSETESLKIQILNLQYALKTEQEKTANLTIVYGQCQSTLLKDTSGLQSSVEALRAEIEKNHDGFSFDITTGVFTKKAPTVEKK